MCTVVLHQALHFFLGAFVPLGDVHVERVVAAGLAVGPLPPLPEGANQGGAGLRHHVVDCNSTNSTGQTSRAQTEPELPNRLGRGGLEMGRVPTDHGGPPSQGRPGALVEVVCCHHASVGHLEAGVHVNAPGHHHPPVSLYGLDPSGDDEVVSNLPEGEKGNVSKAAGFCP